MTAKSRRRRLVPKSGVEVCEIRVARWFDHRGVVQHSVEMTDPEGPIGLDLHDALSLLEMGKVLLIEHAEDA